MVQLCSSASLSKKRFFSTFNHLEQTSPNKARTPLARRRKRSKEVVEKVSLEQVLHHYEDVMCLDEVYLKLVPKKIRSHGQDQLSVQASLKKLLGKNQ